MTASALSNPSENLEERSPREQMPAVLNLTFLGPAIFGLSIGLQLMMTVLVRFGPIVNPILPAMTERGKILAAPERDLPLYMGGLAGTMLLVLASIWIWHRWWMPVTKNRRPAPFARQQSARFASAFVAALGIGSFLCFAVLFNSRFALVPKHNRIEQGRLACVVLLFPAIAAVFCATFDLCFGVVSPRASLLGLSLSLSKPGKSRWLRAAIDVGVVLLIVFCVYIPRARWADLAGSFYQADELHHWNFFAFGPVLEFIHGKAFGTDFYSQYGIGWPLTFALLCHGKAFTVAHMVGIEVTYGCVYYVALYALLRLLLKSVPWAVSGVLLAIMLQLFSGIDAGAIMWNFPSSTVLRHPADVWFFIALLIYRRSGRVGWIGLAGALAGAGVLYELDTGVYLPAIFAFYLLLCFFASKPRLNASQVVSRFVLFGVPCLIVLLIGLWTGSRGTLFKAAFYRGWGEGLEVQAFAGIGLMPIASVDDTGMLLFVSMLAVYLLTLGWEMARHFFGEADDESTLLACICAYGLAVLLVFVGRSHPYNLYHAAIPFVIVIVALLNRTRRWVVPQLPRTSIPTVIVLGVALAFWSKPQFRAYPSLEKTLFAKAAAVGEALRLRPLDLAGLPQSYRHQAETLRTVAARMHRQSTAGNQILVLDDNDTVLYYLSGVEPWSRYASLFHSVMTQKMLEDTQSEILSRRPSVIFIRADKPKKWSFDDVWAVYQKLLASHYKLQEHIGMYEMWRINAP